jgi:hypothetical protein
MDDEIPGSLVSLQTFGFESANLGIEIVRRLTHMFETVVA